MTTEEQTTGIAWSVVDRQVADLLATRSYDVALTVLAEAQALEEVAAARVRQTVGHARRNGCTWEQIGAALGVTRQGAQKRYGADPLPPRQPIPLRDLLAPQRPWGAPAGGDPSRSGSNRETLRG